MRGAAMLGFIPFLKSKYEIVKSAGAKINKRARKVQQYLQKTYEGKKHEPSQEGSITCYSGTATSLESLIYFVHTLTHVQWSKNYY
jgi:hypothetical protein